MLGYVRAEKSELKMREYTCYSGYYCGVCQSIGRRYGQLPRTVLSYDAVFLALLLAGLSPDKNVPLRERCPLHPLRKRTVLHNPAIDYAGDIMLIMAWYKFQDDIHDEGKISARVAARLMKKNFARLKSQRTGLCQRIEDHLARISALEQAQCASLDQAAEGFANIMEAVLDESPLPEGFPEKTALSRIGYHLGKWIYLMDAMDDLAENIKNGTYNPLLCRFAYQKGEPDFRGRIREACRFNLFHYLAEISKAADCLPLRKHKGIIENVIYLGLYKKTEEQIKKEVL